MSKILTSIWACVAVLTLLIGIRIIDPDPIERIRLISFDAKINSIPETQSDQIVLLNIGEKALEVNGQWPWPRQYFAQMISDLRNANAGIIGIGTEAPYTNGLLHCDGHLVLTAAGNAPKIIFDEYGTGTDPKAQIEMDQESSTAASMRFYTEASGTLSERLRIASNGALGIAGANYGSSGQVLTSGGSGSAPTWSTVASGGASNISFNSGYGIDFSATADGTGSSQAEILDDYEEGSWTPTVSTGNASFSTMTGRYVKIGRQVTLWFRISGGGSYSGSGSLGLQGIPFSNSTAVNPIGTSEFYKIDFARDYSDLVTCYLAGSTIRWLRNSSGGGSGNYLTVNLFYSGAAITGMLTYETNS